MVVGKGSDAVDELPGMMNRLLKAYSEMKVVEQAFTQEVFGGKTIFFFHFEKWPDLKLPAVSDEPTIVE